MSGKMQRGRFMLHSQASHKFMASYLSFPRAGIASRKQWELRGLGKLTHNLTFELLLCLHTYSM